ncbi:MAG: winged helix-turn-helix transcriptional regulator [Nitrospirae bacterium]|nr:winged helix-turn-helix transcriptional regulator [Nitrospirota bacterium]
MKGREIFEFHAEFCRVFSNPKRLMIVEFLKHGEMTGSDIVKKLGSSKANVSQHLSVMKMMRILKTRRAGKNIYFRIANKKLTDACCMMQDSLRELLKGVPGRR